MGACAGLKWVQLLGQDLPPLIFQRKKQIRLGMRSEFVENSQNPIQSFGEDLVQPALSLKGLGAVEDLSLRWVGSPHLHPIPSSWHCRPSPSEILGQRSLICCLFNSSTGGPSDNLLNFSHIV